MKKNKQSYLSRRSFFWRSSRLLFLATGASIANKANIVKAANPPSGGTIPRSRHGKQCGLSGTECTSGSTGTSLKLSWKKCCCIGTSFQCCDYADYCWPKGSGKGIPNLIEWCGGDDYDCTLIKCTGSYNTLADCMSSCTENC